MGTHADSCFKACLAATIIHEKHKHFHPLMENRRKTLFECHWEKGKAAIRMQFQQFPSLFFPSTTKGNLGVAQGALKPKLECRFQFHPSSILTHSDVGPPMLPWSRWSSMSYALYQIYSQSPESNGLGPTEHGKITSLCQMGHGPNGLLGLDFGTNDPYLLVNLNF